jgi:hypothetical protein
MALFLQGDRVGWCCGYFRIGLNKSEMLLRDVIADGAKAFWRSLSSPKSGIPENSEKDKNYRDFYFI